MESVNVPHLCSSTHQEIENDQIQFPNDEKNNYYRQQKTKDPASVMECEILQESEIEEDRDHPIFRIYLTMDMLLKTLNRSDLLRSRGISSNFNFFATYVLLTSPSPISLDFEYNWELEQYICSTPKPESPWENNLNINDSSNTLMNLSKLMETSTDFPCKKYTFRNGILRSKDLQTFLELHGSEVRALSIQIYCPISRAHQIELDKEGELQGDERCIDLLRKLLLEQIPNVKSLKLSKFPWVWSILKQKMYSEEIEKEIQSLKNSDNYPYLTNLQNLIISVYFHHWANVPSQIIGEILDTAINLEKVYCRLSKPLRQHNKFHLLQSMTIYVSCDNLEKFEQIATYPRSRLRSIKIMLEELTTKDYTLLQERFGKALHKILEACSSTLEHIQFFSPCGFLCGPNLRFKIPFLPKVKCILACMSDAKRLNESDCPKEIQTHLTSRFFPPGFQFKTTFPHLTEIAFFFYESAAWEDHFENNYEPSLTVKSLIFTRSETLPYGCMLSCSKFFPNTEFLEIRPKYFSFYDASQDGLFNFERLKELRCDLVLNTELNNLLTPGNAFPFLDAAFTGYSPTVIEYLHHELVNSSVTQLKGNVEFFQTLHESPRSRSILNLKDFRRLKITIVDSANEIRAVYPSIFSHLASILGFQRLARLQLQLEYRVLLQQNLEKVMQKMEPIRPFVELHDTERYTDICFKHYYDAESIMKI